MKSLAINGLNDIYIGADGNLAIVSARDAVLQNCATAMQAQRGEMQFDMGRGMPTRATVYDTYNPVQFIAAGRATLKVVEGVVSVEAFNISKTGEVMNYAATIKTIYGIGEING